MAFFASLLAYIFAVGGIVLAMAMSYAVLLAPPAAEPPSPSHAVAAIVHQSPPQAPSPPAVKTAQAPSPRSEVSHFAQAETTRKSRAAAARKAMAANETARQRRVGSAEAGAYAGLWAFQRPPDRGGWRFGYAEEEANSFGRGW